MRKFAVAYFAASCDSVEKNTKFAESLKLNYPILSDPEKETAKAYGVVTEKRAFPFRWTFYIDPEGKIAFIDTEVRAAKHGEDVVAKLEELKVAKKKENENEEAKEE